MMLACELRSATELAAAAVAVTVGARAAAAAHRANACPGAAERKTRGGTE